MAACFDGAYLLAAELTGDQEFQSQYRHCHRFQGDHNEDAIVRFPQDLAPSLAAGGDPLILTGASRTADIEKRIVRGIHGPEALVVVVGGGA